MKKITFFLTKEIKTIVFYFLGFYTCFLALSADFFNIEGLTMEKKCQVTLATISVILATIGIWFNRRRTKIERTINAISTISYLDIEKLGETIAEKIKNMKEDPKQKQKKLEAIYNNNEQLKKFFDDIFNDKEFSKQINNVRILADSFNLIFVGVIYFDHYKIDIIRKKIGAYAIKLWMMYWPILVYHRNLFDISDKFFKIPIDSYDKYLGAFEKWILNEIEDGKIDDGFKLAIAITSHYTPDKEVIY